MAADMKVEMVGVKDTIRALSKVDPEFRKEFNRGAKAIAAPMVAEAKGLYPSLPLSGMARAWTPREFALLPWQVSKVRSSVKLKTSLRKNKESVLYISQANPGAVLFETISSSKPMGRNIRARSPKVLWPAAEKHLPAITRGIEQLVRDAERTVQGMVN